MRGFCLEVAGDFACFTRPEMKVERVSYDVITPSSARAIFSAVLWKPAIRWRITKIEIMNPVRWFSVRRNEVASIASPRSNAIFIEDVRQQRAGLILRDVRYRIHAQFDFLPQKAQQIDNTPPEWVMEQKNASGKENTRHEDESEEKYAAMFARRAGKGQCFMQPYLGCREFACSFRLVHNPDSEQDFPIPESRDLGFMLYDLDYSDLQNIKPLFYRPTLENGVIMVPPLESEEVYR